MYLYAYRVLLPLPLLLCVAILLFVLQLLLPAAVRHRVPDGKNWFCWFSGPDFQSFFFSPFNHKFTLNVPLGSTVAFTASVYLHRR